MHPQEIINSVLKTECWMTQLPSAIKSLPLIHLSIPGSHDSFTSSLTARSPLAPDAEPILRRLSFLGPILSRFMVKWTKTQNFSALEQLTAGIRYFDVRIATKRGTNKFFIVHGMYADEMAPILNSLNTFLDTHPHEVVLLDFQHFYNFSMSNHKELIGLIEKVFTNKLVPFSNNMTSLSLKYLNENSYQVLVIYRNKCICQDKLHLLWPSECLPNPWLNTRSVVQLLENLEIGLSQRSSSNGYVSQCILTPTMAFICKHLFSNLKNQCVTPLEKPMYQWLMEQKPGPNGVNVIIADYIDNDGCLFAKNVINLNYKWLKQCNFEENQVR